MSNMVLGDASASKKMAMTRMIKQCNLNLCCDSWVLGPVIPLDISETQSVCPCSKQMAMMSTASMIGRNCVILVAG